MNIETNLPLVEEILGASRCVIGSDYDAYRNHVYRVINLCFSTGSYGLDDREKIQIAACFHDLGIWTDKTLDYLHPSEHAASKYLEATGRAAWIPEISMMIRMHHKLRACEASGSSLVEAFRRADMADFSLGVFRMGISAGLIVRLKSEFPNSGFHRMLLKLGGCWIIRHPLNPFPMFRW